MKLTYGSSAFNNNGRELTRSSDIFCDSPHARENTEPEYTSRNTKNETSITNPGLNFIGIRLLPGAQKEALCLVENYGNSDLAKISEIS